MDTQTFEQKYVIGPGFDKIVDRQLRTQLIDFGHQSGPHVAVKKLQQIVGAAQTGVLDTETATALSAFHPDDVCNSLVVLRVKMICELVTKHPAQLPMLSASVDRALQFLQ